MSPGGSGLDPRFNAFRADLAAANLEGQVEATRFVEGVRAQVANPSAALRCAPRFDAPLGTEALMGEMLEVFDENEGWSWAQLERDDYVGYVEADALDATIRIPTHRVTALRTFVFPQPDIKAPPLYAASLGAGLVVAGERDGFLVLERGGFVHAAHGAPAEMPADDFVAVAMRFLDTPYLWGGRTSLGIDCSGLVQIALEAAGKQAPRDSDVQAERLGAALPNLRDTSALRRGDLVFWKGHVGIMADRTRLLHANAHHMETVIEPMADAVERIAVAGHEILAIKRL